jgi:hypothetical protein
MVGTVTKLMDFNDEIIEKAVDTFDVTDETQTLKSTK